MLGSWRGKAGPLGWPVLVYFSKDLRACWWELASRVSLPFTLFHLPRTGGLPPLVGFDCADPFSGAARVELEAKEGSGFCTVAVSAMLVESMLAARLIVASVLRGTETGRLGSSFSPRLECCAVWSAVLHPYPVSSTWLSFRLWGRLGPLFRTGPRAPPSL